MLLQQPALLRSYRVLVKLLLGSENTFISRTKALAAAGGSSKGLLGIVPKKLGIVPKSANLGRKKPDCGQLKVLAGDWVMQTRQCREMKPGPHQPRGSGSSLLGPAARDVNSKH